jgi:hypothetical protein
MFSKLFKKLLSETTNVADTTAVTFNTSGNYNPKYGKQKVYVSGRGGTGTTVPGNYFDNSYTNAAVYTPAYTTYTGSLYAGYTAPTVLTYAGTVNAWYLNTVPYSYFNSYAYNSPSFGTPTYSSTAYVGEYLGPFTGSVPAPSGSPTATTNIPIGASPVPASYTPGNYVAGNSGTNPVYRTTGTAANILGVTLPGGYGTFATVVPATLISNPKYGTTTTVTIPSGGYATITFTL